MLYESDSFCKFLVEFSDNEHISFFRSAVVIAGKRASSIPLVCEAYKTISDPSGSSAGAAYSSLLDKHTVVGQL